MVEIIAAGVACIKICLESLLPFWKVFRYSMKTATIIIKTPPKDNIKESVFGISPFSTENGAATYPIAIVAYAGSHDISSRRL
jgi:hypothetical protein